MSFKFLIRNISIDLHTCQQVAEVFLLPAFISREARVFLHTSFRRFQDGCLLGNVILFVATAILETLLRLCGIISEVQMFHSSGKLEFSVILSRDSIRHGSYVHHFGWPFLEDLQKCALTTSCLRSSTTFPRTLFQHQLVGPYEAGDEQRFRLSVFSVGHGVIVPASGL